jgi:hypothetical protein
VLLFEFSLLPYDLFGKEAQQGWLRGAAWFNALILKFYFALRTAWDMLSDKASAFIISQSCIDARMRILLVFNARAQE